MITLAVFDISIWIALQKNLTHWRFCTFSCAPEGNVMKIAVEVRKSKRRSTRRRRKKPEAKRLAQVGEIARWSDQEFDPKMFPLRFLIKLLNIHLTLVIWRSFLPLQGAKSTTHNSKLSQQAYFLNKINKSSRQVPKCFERCLSWLLGMLLPCPGPAWIRKKNFGPENYFFANFFFRKFFITGIFDFLN